MDEVGTSDAGVDRMTIGADRDHGRLRVHIKQDAPMPLDVTLDCAAGEVLALVGPSGAGKTSLLRAIAGLMRPAFGHVSVGDRVLFDHASKINISPQDRRVGFVFQDYALFPHLSAVDTVALAIPNTRIGRERGRRAVHLLELVNLDGLGDRKPAALSGGQRQRVALARALAREPAILLLDEPFSAVDQVTREKLKRELALIRAQLTCPIVFVSHDLAEATALGDRIAVMRHGSVIDCGAAERVRLKPRSSETARLIGQMNVFSGRVMKCASPPVLGDAAEDADHTANYGAISWGPQTLALADTGSFLVGDAVSWLIPTESIVLHRRGRPSLGDRENAVTGVVTEVVTLGDQTSVRLRRDNAGSPRDATLQFKIATHAARRNGLVPGVTATVSLLGAEIHVMPPDTQ